MEGALKVNRVANWTVEATWRKNRRGARGFPKEPINAHGTRVEEKDWKLRAKDFDLRSRANGGWIDLKSKLSQRTFRFSSKVNKTKEFL